MGTVLESTKALVKIRKRSWEEGRASLKLVKLLPIELQELDGQADTGYYGSDIHISINQFNNKGVDILAVAKMLGIQGLTPKFSEPDNWNTKGTFIFNGGMTADIFLYGIPNPPNCRIEAYQEEVTKYRAICPETNEELS